MGIPEEEKEQRIPNLFEKVMTENFLDVIRQKVKRAQESQSSN